jgi:translation initiation factor 4A
MNNKLKMDNLDDEFESSWNNNDQNELISNLSIIDKVDIIINTEKIEIKAEKIEIKTETLEIKTNIEILPVETRKMTALEALVSTRIPEKEKDIENYEQKVNQLKEQGTIMLEEYKERGILVNDIDSSMIISKWSDCKLLDANPNTVYLDNLVKSIENFGFESPRPIQCITAGRISKKGDLIVQAKAGNGKTAAFVFGSAIGINPNQFKTQVLILSPTQLLTDQTTEVVNNLTAQTGITVHCHRGGLPLTRDSKVPHIIVGCPGRIIDLIKRKKINLSFLKTVILDEGDELLKQGFREQVKNIIETLEDSVQICLFSATLPKGILELCTRFMRNPAYVILPENQVITELVTQWYVKCATIYEKDGCLVDLIEANQKDTIIVFFNSCSRLEKVSQILVEYNKPIQHLCIHGKMDPNDKVNSIANFVAGKCKILLASDIAARGLDIPNVTLVVNYDIPASIDTYVHRIGRSGRGALFGNSVTLIMSEEDKQKMTFIVQVHGIPIKVLKTVNMESKPKF